MLTWITEKPAPVYICLATAAAALAAVYFSDRRRLYLFGVGAVALLAGVVWLVDWLVVTDREQVQLNVLEMAKAAEKGDSARLGLFLASDFEWKGVDRQKLLDRLAKDLDPAGTRSLKGWVDDVSQIGDNEILCSFGFVADGDWGGWNLVSASVRVDFTFVRDGSDWKVRSMRVFRVPGNVEVTPSHLRR